MIHRGVASIAGQPVDEVRLGAGDMEVALLSYGALTRSWRVGGRGIVLGYEDPAAYASDPYYHGAICGRVAGRIKASRFPLEGHEVVLPANNGPNHLHGGPAGISRQHWLVEEDSASNAARFTYTSPDGESGYPGEVAFEVIVRLTGTSLTYDMRATVDRPTPVALAQHNYYNLTGTEIWDHVVTIPAGRYLVADEALIQTGRTADVAGTRYDFRRPTRVGDNAPAREMMDASLVLEAGDPGAVLSAPGGPTLSFFTDQPCMHLYNANTLGAPFFPFGAICLEPEAWLDALNQPHFPSVLVTPEANYRQVLTIEVS